MCKIRKLTWEKYNGKFWDYTTCETEDDVCRFFIKFHPKHHRYEVQGVEDVGTFDSLEEAKEKCQEFFEERVKYFLEN